MKNKIFPLLVLLLAVTLNSFSGVKGVVRAEVLFISAQVVNPLKSNRADAEIPQNTKEQENDNKVEDADDPFILEHFSITDINHQVSIIYEFQIALYHEHHQVIFTPPPEA